LERIPEASARPVSGMMDGWAAEGTAPLPLNAATGLKRNTASVGERTANAPATLPWIN
jgi:hypothetical protein